MIADLRLEFGDVPVVAGELGRYLDDYTRKAMNWRAINSQLHVLEGRIPRFAVVSSEGLTANRDNLHLNTESLRVFGVRYASAMLNLLRAGGGSIQLPNLGLNSIFKMRTKQ